MYSQITVAERYTLGILRQLGYRPAVVARVLGRHRSTIGRELRRNRRDDGSYRPGLAQAWARARRSRSRRNQHFTAADYALVRTYLEQQWSPEQVAGYLRRVQRLAISHETIYRHIWADRRQGGTLYTQLRGARKQRRKRYGRYDSRGRLAGKRPLAARPAQVAARTEVGHWEVDTVLGAGDRHCVLSLVERRTGYLVLGKLAARSTTEVTPRARQLISRERRPVRTVTADNGTEFHDYATIEAATGAQFYFATPHHAWERGTNENTNGLLRQYLPKGQSMAHLTQADCDRLAHRLNARPRKRLGFHTPEECYGL
ncbi:MAG: IS30 family transposase [Gemmatimonadales bacterium]